MLAATIFASEVSMPTSWVARTLGGGAGDPNQLAGTSGAEATELMPAVTIVNPGQWWPVKAVDFQTGLG